MEAEPFTWHTLAGLLGLFFGALLYSWVKSWLDGRKEGQEIVQPKQVILEHAELADLSLLHAQLVAVGPKLDALVAQNAGRKSEMSALRHGVDEALGMLRRMTTELDVAKRIREEEILRVQKRDGLRD